MRGIITSSRMMSGSSDSASSSAVGPLNAGITWKYSLDSLASSSLTLSSTSSTTSTRAVMAYQPVQGEPGTAGSRQEALDRFQKAGDRDRLGDIGLATTPADLFLVALHRERGHRD